MPSTVLTVAAQQQECERGQPNWITLSLTPVAGALLSADPSTLSLTIRDPQSTSTTVTLAGAAIVRDTAGQQYHYIHTSTLTGRHAITATSTGPAAKASCEYLAITAATDG